MYITAALDSIYILICYFSLIVTLPSLILGNSIRSENIFKRFVIYLIFGNFYISSIVFVLAYLKIFNGYSMITCLIILSLLIWGGLNRSSLSKMSRKIKEELGPLILGTYGSRLFFKRVWIKLIKRIKLFFLELFRGKKMEWMLFLFIVGYNVYQYGINNIEYLTYIAPDEEVHLYWIQSLLGGSIFPRGVYPHVFHNIIGAISTIFGLNATIALKNFAPTMCALIMTMLYFGLRKIFSTKYPALFGFLIYSVFNIYVEQATLRFQFAIPQEYAMIMLMPMVIFLVDYIREKKKVDLIFFGMSLSLMLGIHFYTGIIAIIMIGSIGMVYLYKMIKDQLLAKLFVCGLLSIILALAPLGIGLALGYEMEQSMGWATEVIQGEIYTQSPDNQAFTLQSFGQQAQRDITKHVVADMKVFYVFLSIMALTLIFNMGLIREGKGDSKSVYQIIFAVNAFLLIFLILLRALQLPTIMEAKRVAIFFAYFSPILIGMPLEIMNRLTHKTAFNKAMPALSVGAMALGLLLIIRFKLIRPLPPFYYFQPTGTMVANMGILDDYEDGSWTAVSPVNNIGAILNHGLHYELSDFIVAQENWDKKKEIRIPTEYVFIYIEKRPIINYGFRFYRDEFDVMSRDIINQRDAVKELSDSQEEVSYYEKERYILMAKAFYWAKQYQTYFPQEMNVFYEDAELIVYRIKQNQQALNNFSIDYGFNSR